MAVNTPVKIGIVGIGSMGQNHARSLVDNKVKGAILGAVCDPNQAALDLFPQVKGFGNYEALIRSGEVDAVLIATPHYDHTTIGIASLEAGLHTLVEKPISVHKADCERLIAAHRDPKVVFAAMFNQRTDPFWIKIRDLVKSGELGAIRRIHWVVTDWFRSDAYYNSGGWRATWSGEGGGVLLNQCPHNLDILQWIFGMPESIWADCRIGHHHNIEVEDEVTAYLRYANGATGVFITSTGEAPGTNRLEVAGERGKVIYENGQLRWERNEVETSTFCKTTNSKFSKPDIWNVSFPLDSSNHGPQHVGIMQNFVDAILEGKELLAPAAEGIHSVELANAMLLSAAKEAVVSLPINGEEYELLLKKRIEQSTFVKPETTAPAADEDFAASFAR
ncbi:MAG: Gfo/Idh/MocA family protein [Puniceicoccaceae bacterium]